MQRLYENPLSLLSRFRRDLRVAVCILQDLSSQDDFHHSLTSCHFSQAKLLERIWLVAAEEDDTTRHTV